MDSKYNDTVYINRTKFTITNTNDDRNMGIINQNTDADPADSRKNLKLTVESIRIKLCNQ